MTVLEAIKRHQPVTASEIAYHLRKPLEAIYPQLVHLDACQKAAILKENSANGPRQWIVKEAA